MVTGSRADYGLLKRLMKLIDSDPEMKLQIIVTGSHLSSKHGLTYKEIEEDGFQIDFKVDILEEIIDAQSTARAMSKAQIEITKILSEIKSQVLKGGSSGLDVFGTDFYNVKDNFSADAMSCYALHNRPQGQCPDYKSERKVLTPATEKDRKEAGLKKSNVKIHLCDFCPVKMYNQKRAYQSKGLYN